MLSLLACNQTPDKKQTEVMTQSDLVLSGKIFFYAPEFDSTTGKATGHCDCCSGHLFFINDSEFLNIDYCEANTTFVAGKYKTKANEIMLMSDSICLTKSYNWINETEEQNETTEEYSYTTSIKTCSTEILKRHPFKNQVYFIPESGERYFYTRDSSIDITKGLMQLNKEGILNKLKLH